MPPPHVLVVEDFDDARAMFTDLLSLAGYLVSQARDGVEAVTLATALMPDMILMDLGLPRLDGCTAASRIKADRRTTAIPIVAITAYMDPAAHQRALAAGCERVLIKPCDPDYLIVTIGAMLGDAMN